jgi:hypothetical protein
MFSVQYLQNLSKNNNISSSRGFILRLSWIWRLPMSIGWLARWCQDETETADLSLEVRLSKIEQKLLIRKQQRNG